MHNTKSHPKQRRKRLYAPWFLLIFVLIFAALNHTCVAMQSYCSTWDAIQNGNGPEILIMGNSHANKSFVPPIIDAALDVDCGVLSSNSQYMAMATQNLKVVLHYYTPRLIILEAYTPATNTQDTIPKSDYYQNSDGIHNPLLRLKFLAKAGKMEDIPAGMFPLLRSNQRWQRWQTSGASASAPYNSSDIEGYMFSISSHATGSVDIAQIAASYLKAYANDTYTPKLTEENKAALQEFLEICDSHHIEVWIIKAPTVQQTHSDTIKELKAFTKDYPCVTMLTDTHPDMEKMGLTVEDFYDNGHLSRRGSIKFTEYFISLYAQKTNTTPDFTNVFFYRDEQIEQLSSGQYRWQMRFFGENVYRFELEDETGKRTILKDFSETDFVILPFGQSIKTNVIVTAMPRKAYLQNDFSQTMRVSFMQQNTCVLN